MATIEYLTNELVSRHRGTLPLLLFERDADLKTRTITVLLAERLLELCGQTPCVVIADYHRRHIDEQLARALTVLIRDRACAVSAPEGVYLRGEANACR